MRMADGTRSGSPSNQFGFRHPAGSCARRGNDTFLRAISHENVLSFLDVSELYQSLRVEDPIVWIPHDPFSISNDEIIRIRQRFGNV